MLDPPFITYSAPYSLSRPRVYNCYFGTGSWCTTLWVSLLPCGHCLQCRRTQPELDPLTHITTGLRSNLRLQKPGPRVRDVVIILWLRSEELAGSKEERWMEKSTTTSSCWIRSCRRCDDVSKWSRKYTYLPFHKGSAIVWLGSYWKTNFSSSCFLEVCQSFMIGVISWTCLVSSVPARMYISCLLAHAFSALTFELSSNSLPVYQ